MPVHLDLCYAGKTTGYATHFAPLAYLATCYQAQNLLKPLENVPLRGKTVTFSPTDKLVQVLVSVLAGCAYLVEIKTCLSTETPLAQVWGWSHFADPSTLSRSLDQLSQKQLVDLAAACQAVRQQISPLPQHDWRGYLWLDYDLSGLPAGKQAQGSTKGYFGGKKTSPDAN